MRAKRAVVVGAGPNGLAAAVKLAEAGVHVELHEAGDTVGGGCRTRELTLPGFRHDVCASVLPFARDSPAFRDLGIEWVDPEIAAAHALDGDAVVLRRDFAVTARELGADADAYRRVVGPFVRAWPRYTKRDLLRARPAHLYGFVDAERLLRRFTTERARGFVAGHAAHSALPLHRAPSAGFAFVLCASAHTSGWPFARGGSQSVVDALAHRLRELGGEIHLESCVDALPHADAVLFDTAPHAAARIANVSGFAPRFTHAPGAFKLDWALDGPIPWTHPDLGRAGTVHLGGPAEEIVASERASCGGRGAGDPPFVLLAQPSLFDATRAPAGKHTAWAYCHVPNGWTGDATAAIEAQVERFAPGFRDLILARHVMRPADLEDYNANDVGGDIVGGLMSLRQLLARPTWRLWRLPRRGVFICSASTPPGGGVHGLCGLAAAWLALRELRS